jgi:hypothetical protein
VQKRPTLWDNGKLEYFFKVVAVAPSAARDQKIAIGFQPMAVASSLARRPVRHPVALPRRRRQTGGHIIF